MGCNPRINKYAGSPRNEIYLTALIKTGGRAGEVLGLEKENFSVNALVCPEITKVYVLVGVSYFLRNVQA